MTILHDNLYTKRACSYPPERNRYLSRHVGQQGSITMAKKKTSAELAKEQSEIAKVEGMLEMLSVALAALNKPLRKKIKKRLLRIPAKKLKLSPKLKRRRLAMTMLKKIRIWKGRRLLRLAALQVAHHPGLRAGLRAGLRCLHLLKLQRK